MNEMKVHQKKKKKCKKCSYTVSCETAQVERNMDKVQDNDDF